MQWMIFYIHQLKVNRKKKWDNVYKQWYPRNAHTDPTHILLLWLFLATSKPGAKLFSKAYSQL